MCGFCGLSFVPNENLDIAKNFGKKLNSELFHRGPDADGKHISFKNTNNLLFHRRLSILEISEKGSQPMLSHDNKYTLTFNGEIYNHLNIRKKLSKEFNIKWRGNSDTETLLESISFFPILNLPI